MPDPRTLAVGDRVRFVSLPEEWERPGYYVHPESVEFMKTLIARKRSSRVCRIDEHGIPWIDARTRDEDGKIGWHSWSIFESTGWVRAQRRS